MTLLEALKELQQEGPLSVRDGICHNVEALLYDAEGRDIFDGQQEDPCDLLEPHFKSWDEFSGDDAYPVADTIGIRPSSAYWSRHNYDKWAGDYGAARKRLLQHCINELEALE